MLKAVGATNITPWTHEESQRQLWTKSPNGEADKVAFATLYRNGFLTSIPKNTKKALWERFTEEYSNGMHCTSFMTCLKGGQYVYRENLGGLCSICNDCGYMVFRDIGQV
ncbi:hypothetical protein GLOIN_2v1472586 [Rhizophagus clarus]|uniref:Uncharacterized protein n=1 Tax=Rhizophagus clarus TaxID=94130 RepID=A0A8H3QWW8_9GLOM|nr:hypothetical protein GLOIN_2v1472586 [Rhizophagus clarus]